jgi:hypothetical protein
VAIGFHVDENDSFAASLASFQLSIEREDSKRQFLMTNVLQVSRQSSCQEVFSCADDGSEGNGSDLLEK